MAIGTRRRPGRRLRPLYALELRGRTTRDEVRMLPQFHARPRRSTRPSGGTACSRLPRPPVSTRVCETWWSTPACCPRQGKKRRWQAGAPRGCPGAASVRDHWLRPGWLPVIKVSLASFENPIFLDRVALAAPPCGSDRLRHVPPMTQLLPRSAVAERGIFSRRCCGLSDLVC